MQAKHKNTGRWEGVKPRLSHFQVYLTAKKCGPASKTPNKTSGAKTQNHETKAPPKKYNSSNNKPVRRGSGTHDCSKHIRSSFRFFFSSA
jgi:hypothetical protein